MMASEQSIGSRAVTLAIALVVALGALVVAPIATPAETAEAMPGGRASRYVAITPIRVLDTREPGSPTRLPDDSALSIAPITAGVAAAAGVDPDDVEAVAINVVDAGGVGYATAWPTGTDRSLVSSVNMQLLGDTVPNLVVVPLGADDMISIYSLPDADIVVDVQGVFERTTASRAGRFVPVTPTRAIDTREGVGIPPRSSIPVTMPSVVPADATAVVLNVTATDTLGPGYLTVWADGATRPDPASNVNYPGAGHQVANSVISGVTNRKVRVYSESGSDVVVDVIGYMTGPSAPLDDAGLYVSLPPRRHWDSRSNTRTPPSAATIGVRGDARVPVAGSSGVPSSGVLAITMNLTMTNTFGPGYLEAYPGGAPRPEPYSSVNAIRAGQDVANHVFVGLHDGGFRLYSSSGTDVVIDITGYFLDGTTTPPNAPPDPDPVVAEPTPLTPAVPSAPTPSSEAYEYLYYSSGGAYPRNGGRYLGWAPCSTITYAVDGRRATQAHIDTLNAAIKQIENATGFDFVYKGEATGSLDTETGIDFPVFGGQRVMAVIAFSDAGATPILAGGTIGVGGAQGDSNEIIRRVGSSNYLVGGGFAIADISDLTTGGDLLSTFVHELAHMVGLDHVNAAGELMRPVLTSQTTLGPGDKTGLYRIGAKNCGGAPLTTSSYDAAPTPVGGRIDMWVAD